MSRNDRYAQIHLGAARLGWDEETRRAWMEKLTGKRSSTECTYAELKCLCEDLRTLGALDDGRPIGKADQGGRTRGRPSREQWKKIAFLCKQRGWPGGIDDPGFAAFARRIAKVDNPRFLTADRIAKVIVGLERWIEHDQANDVSAGKSASSLQQAQEGTEAPIVRRCLDCRKRMKQIKNGVALCLPTGSPVVLKVPNNCQLFERAAQSRTVTESIRNKP
ncbi:MAG: regulatory protein GemA [Zoogloeaceae bacterium]|nr:regulatory protein GemA [Zoogloeaceae bacterium]